MNMIPVFSTNKKLNTKIISICKKYGDGFIPVFFDSRNKFLDYLEYELPELNILNFMEKDIDIFSILETIKNDSWLHYGGIIGIHNTEDEHQVLERMPNSNVLSTLRLTEFDATFPRLLKILKENRQFLFQRYIQGSLIENMSGSFTMDNDPFDVKTYTNLITNYLFNSNYIDAEGKERLHVALIELLLNAIEHGNCSISYDEKSKWLETNGDIIELIKKKNKNPAVRKKHVFLSYTIMPERSFITIQDEGEGFQWKEEPALISEHTELPLHGHGIQMTKMFVENLSYNDKGNCATFEVSHLLNTANRIPRVFKDQKEITFTTNQVIFREGEVSNYLYYIVTGKFKIFKKGKHISTLAAEDIFLGEMSFLGNNTRTATVKAQGKCVLIEISRDDFLKAIKNQPHYGIFLARLLAQRLLRLHDELQVNKIS